MDKYKILELLQETGGFFSGEAIAGALSVSRTAVSDAVGELRREGYAIESRTKRGYRYIGGEDILNRYEIQKLIPGYEIIYFSSVDSTNNAAKKIMGGGEKGNIIVIAENQTGGRGRYGRSFFCREKKGLYFSLAESPPQVCVPGNEGFDLTIIPIIASLAVSEAVAGLTGLDVRIKWPNDILCGKKKLCGILTEASVEAESGRIKYYVVGIGINVHHTKEDFPEDIADVATSIFLESGKTFERKLILASVVKLFKEFTALPPSGIIEKYKKRLITDWKITFHKNGAKYAGYISDVRENGNIAVQTDSGEVTLGSGEINFI